MENQLMNSQALPAKTENIWAGIIAAVSVLGSWIFACMMPFAAIGAMLAATLPLRKAMLWMSGVWLSNQLVGYLVLGYPQTVNSFAHGGALLLASLGGLFVAIKVLEWRGNRNVLNIALAFVGAFAAYEAILYIAALYLGGIENFSAGIVWLIAKNDMIWFAGLLALNIALTRAMPQVFGATPALHKA